MQRTLRIGTRNSELAVWQATLVQNLLKEGGTASELVYIKSEGDLDTVTPLYELGVQGIFTKALDAALLNNRIDVAVHSMKDVPTRLAEGIQQAAVLKRASHKDIFVFNGSGGEMQLALEISNWENKSPGTQLPAPEFFTIATSSIRRRAQWLNRYPHHHIENLRGNVNTRLRKVAESTWNGAIFAAAGLERIHLRPKNSIDLNWMLPAPAQGAIIMVCRKNDEEVYQACLPLNDEATALCTKIERDFLKTLMGGCSTPISALAQIKNNQLCFNGNICSPNGKEKIEVEKKVNIADCNDTGIMAAKQLLQNLSATKIVQDIQHAKK